MKNFVNKKIRNDILLVLVIISLALIAFLVFKLSAREGSEAVITVDGNTYATLPLSKNATLTVTLENGGENTVTVKGGEVFVTSADCPDKICVSHRPIKNVGETIVCLPHKVVVTVEGEGSSSDVDIIS